MRIMSSMLWVQLISLEMFLCCTKNVIYNRTYGNKYHENMNNISQIFSFECTPQFLLRYGTKTHIDSKLYLDLEGNNKSFQII